MTDQPIPEAIEPAPTTSHRGWIGVDFDATLARYDKWRGVEHLGEPIPEMVERIRQWVAEGREVRVFTARVWYSRDPYFYDGGWERLTLENLKKIMALPSNSENTSQQMRRFYEAQYSRALIQQWCRQHVGIELAVTHEKDPFMAELWDDRCVQVIPNTGHPITNTCALTHA